MDQLSQDELPPIREIGAALSRVTETLASELTIPTNPAPAWRKFEWGIARAVAAMQGTSCLLFEQTLWEEADWRSFLLEQFRHVAGRHARIAALISLIDLRARENGVQLIALKGAALHALGVYKVGQRPMADIDILVREIDLPRASKLLVDCGYTLTFATWRHRLFEQSDRGCVAAAIGEHIENPIKIELHWSIRERMPVYETDITQYIWSDSFSAGINAYPSVAALMLHLLIHAAGNIRAHALRQIQLHDIALLGRMLGEADWHDLVAYQPSARPIWWAFPPLVLASRYYPGSVPDWVLSAVRSDCRFLLRRSAKNYRLSEVSWSNLKVYAFPGLEWSSSPREAAAFVLSRAWPKREARNELRRFAAHHPGAAKIPWYGISQGGRILRWLFSNPPRVQALLVVKAALDRPQDANPPIRAAIDQ